MAELMSRGRPKGKAMMSIKYQMPEGIEAKALLSDAVPMNGLSLPIR